MMQNKDQIEKEDAEAKICKKMETRAELMESKQADILEVFRAEAVSYAK